MVGELEALGGESVNARRGELFLAVAGKVAIAEVIRKDVDDIGLFRGLGGDEGEQGKGRE